MPVDALLLSLEVGLFASLVAGTLALAVIAFTHRRRAAGLIDAVLTAPLVLPPTVLGYYLLTLLGRRSAVGVVFESLTGSSLVFTRTGAVIAASVTAFPLILQSARAAIDSVDGTLLDAARTLGATRWQALQRVAFPLASRGLVAGLLLGFARAIGDFGVTLMVAGNIPGETQTAALALYDAMLSGREHEATSLAITLTLLAVVLIAAVQWLGRRHHAP
ncbi:MAG: molybdate ABC transporter permease subunit [Archangium gephyra]|uniref:Molybdenum transport system permease n=1 Tax=Archangium gephyra TaxID=48 RepID=A0A2W5T1G2_9BACT|nr:MAG: molybdate ABC transporter permease subunit [Archangium gephyra]